MCQEQNNIKIINVKSKFYPMGLWCDPTQDQSGISEYRLIQLQWEFLRTSQNEAQWGQCNRLDLSKSPERAPDEATNCLLTMGLRISPRYLTAVRVPLASTRRAVATTKPVMLDDVAGSGILSTALLLRCCGVFLRVCGVSGWMALNSGWWKSKCLKWDRRVPDAVVHRASWVQVFCTTE